MDDETLNRQLDKGWKKILDASPQDPPGPDFTGWSSRLTPPLPEAWPPDGLSTLFAYAYPCGFSPRLHDAERIGAPWAQVARENDSCVRWTLLREEICEIGIQGFRPLNEEEVRDLKAHCGAPACLGSMTQCPRDGEPAAEMVRGFYRHWFRFNGVIARHLQEHHRDFVDWFQAG